MPEFYDPDVYDARAEGLPGDVDFYLDLARQAHDAGHPVLELACGTGRVAIPIAREGISTVGLDRSSAMLGRAREKAAGLPNARWVDGEMRDFALPERFGLLFIAYRSFQHLMTTADQLSCLRCAHEHLVPGGRLAINVFNPDIVTIGAWLGGMRGQLALRAEDVRDPWSGRATKRWETRSYRTARQEVRASFLDEEVDGEGRVAARSSRELELRYVFRYEMEHLLARSGFEIEALYGDHLRAPFQDASPEMVWLARRPS